MHRYMLTTILAMLLSMNAWSQEEERGAEPGAETQADPATAAGAENADEAIIEEPAADDEVEDEIDISELEEESYADAEEEDFVPTEDIPTDQAIPFPTDI